MDANPFGIEIMCIYRFGSNVRVSSKINNNCNKILINNILGNDSSK